MFAIVEIGGKQIKVEEGKKLFVDFMKDKNTGDKVTFDKVLLLNTGSSVEIGAPYIRNANVTAEVLQHVKGDKVLVFKKKRRKGYQKLNGHRQRFTQILIEKINLK
ncbi:MAG: 50S ribosomal protein L21 [Bacteroidales bacterium]|nr:50S ribosomal protein L21 [Bacteroidales bacterium]